MIESYQKIALLAIIRYKAPLPTQEKNYILLGYLQPERRAEIMPEPTNRIKVTLPDKAEILERLNKSDALIFFDGGSMKDIYDIFANIAAKKEVSGEELYELFLRGTFWETAKRFKLRPTWIDVYHKHILTWMRVLVKEPEVLADAEFYFNKTQAEIRRHELENR